MLKSSGAALTVCVTAAEVLVAKLASPEYTAVMECEPASSEDVERVAWPAAFNAGLPSAVVPSLKVTVPVGVPGEVLATVAVKVTDWPAVDGFNEEARVVVVGAALTVWMSAAEVLVAKVVSPE